MTRVRRRLIEDFLLPALNDETYGELLKWVDPQRSIFSIRWSHKNAAKWTLADTKVFQDWDILKGHFKPDMKGYYMQAKQRFRAALYKLTTVQQVPSKDKHIKYYKIRLDIDRKQEAMSRKAQRIAHKRANQKSIPTPVICKNTYGKGTELIGRDYVEESSSCSSSSTSPSLSMKSEDCDQAQDLKIDFSRKDYIEYQQAVNLQRALSGANCYAPSIKPERTSPNSTVLRESPRMNVNSKAPHVPAQAAPVYSKSALRQAVECSPVKRLVMLGSRSPAMKIIYKNQTVENSQPCVESPTAFNVPTHFSPPPNMAVRDLESSAIHLLANWSNTGAGHLASPGDVQRPNPADVRSNRDVVRRHNPDGVLNLSIKCENPLLVR